MANDILSQTQIHFDSINFSEMSERWIDEAIESEFTDVEDNDMSIGILFTGDAGETLLKISRLCDAWMNKPSSNVVEESNTGDISLRPEEVLWTFLDEMDISVKQIQGVIYFLCCKAIKSSSSLEEKQLGLLSAKWYFNCLRVPGSSAYSVFYFNLFRVCVECLQIPDQVESKDNQYKWKEFEKILPEVVLALESLVPLLSVFYLGNDSSNVEFVIKKLSELVASEVSNNKLDFDLDSLAIPEKRRRYSYSTVATLLAYKGFSNLMQSDLNGEKESIYSYILSKLNHHILCKRSKKVPIPAKFIVIRDNAVAFICHNLKEKNELSSELTVTTLKRLCLSVSDKVDFRATVSLAVLTVMFQLCVQDLAELIKWLLLLVDAADTNNRVFALEMLGLLLTDTPQIDTEGLPESMEVYLTPVPVIFAILTRCDDVASGVRTRALGVISEHMTRALNVLTEMQEPAIFSGEVFDNDFDFNGEHRSFWYNMTSFKDMVAEITAIFHRRLEDTNGMTRRVALQALENVINFDLEYLSKENLKMFTMASKDQGIIMRKQTVQSLTAILEKYPNSALSQEYWLRCVLPLVQDPENSVQTKVLNAIEEKFLQNVFSDIDVHQDAAFGLLKKIAYGEFSSFQRYLQKAFSLWKTDNKLRPQMAAKLEKCLGCGNDEMVWFYLSIFAAFSKLPSKMCKLVVEEFEKPENWESFTFMENILKIVGSQFYHLDKDMLENIRSILMEKIEAYAAPVEILPIMIEILYKIEKYLNNQNKFSEFATKMIQSSLDILTPFVALSQAKNVSTEDFAIKGFTVVKEFCHIFPANISSNLAVILKQFVYPTSNNNATSTKIVTTTLQAHAYAALGKISLQEENLARELLPLLAKELLQSNEDKIRNNVVIILIEMCKRYTSFADKYIPLICACFKDKRYIIRYQSITLLVGLLQEDYIKCKENLLYCILSTIIDKKEGIQELGKFCLLQILYPKKNSIFADHFVDSLFVFNHFPPPGNTRLEQTVIQLERFSLPYDTNVDKRMQIYKFMLNFMNFTSKTFIANALCEEILSSISGSVFPLNRETEWMVRDCFAILSTKEILAFDADTITNEMEDNVEEGLLMTTELSLRRITLIEPVISVMIDLKVYLWGMQSPLYGELIDFVIEFLQDYNDEIDELLKDDNDLLLQVRFEMDRQARRLDKEAKTKSRTEAKSNNAPKVSINQTLAQLIQQDRNSLAPGIVSSAEQDLPQASTSEQGIVRTSMRKLRKSAAGHSAGNSDELMDIESSSSALNQSYLNDPLLSSTPRVVLKKLKKLDLPDISRIAMEVDSD